MPDIAGRTDFPTGRGCARLPVVMTLAAAFSALVLGCGKKGPPLPPLPGSTPRVLDLEMRQVGGTAHASFTLPLRPESPLVDYQTRGVELWRRVHDPRRSERPAPARPAPPRPAKGLEGPPPPPEIPLGEFTDGATLVASVAGDALFDFLSRPTLTLVDPDLPAGIPDKLEYAVVLKTDIRRGGTVSNLAELAPVAPPPTPIDVEIETIEGAVRLSWKLPPSAPTPPTEDEATDADDSGEAPPAPAGPPRVNVYRAMGGNPMPLEPLASSPVAAPPFEDDDVQAGVTHRYVLRSVVTAGDASVESDPSAEIVVVYKDVFPPAAPRGLRVIPEGRRLNLVWNPNEEADLGGYHVHRRVGAGEWTRIDEAPIPSATFTDANPPAGQPIEYAVTAHDDATPPNESERSSSIRAELDAP